MYVAMDDITVISCEQTSVFIEKNGLHGMILARMREVKDPVLKQLQPKIEK